MPIRWCWNEPLFAVLDFQSLCLISPAQFPQSFVVLEWEKERETVGETFVCKTCRGRSIHPFQKNNITFKWNGLEPPNPIFEPRSLSRTFPFWIFHSEVEEGSTSHWGLPTVHSIKKMQELPWSPLLPSAEENYPAFQTILIKLFFCIFLFQICDWYFSFRWWYIKSIWEIKCYDLFWRVFTQFCNKQWLQIQSYAKDAEERSASNFNELDQNFKL